MKENTISQGLLDKLVELNELEIMKSKIFSVLFQKKTKEIIENKIKTLESNFKDQAIYYGQYFEDYESEYNEIVAKYNEQLMQILEKYNELYINISLELQEAECNQKIAIANIKNCYDIKQQLEGKTDEYVIEPYIKKIEACIEKKRNYDFVIYKCEKMLEYSLNEIEKKINEIFVNKNNLISLKNDNGILKLIQRIKNIFTGKSNFRIYVLSPLDAELNLIDEKLLGITNKIQRETITFVARAKDAKDEINIIYKNMI